MSENETAPRIRADLEIIPAVHQGEETFLVRDFFGMIEKPLAFRREAIVFLSLLDGVRTIPDLQVEFVRLQRGAFISTEDIRKLLTELDTALVLDTPRFRAAREAFIDNYAKKRVRESILAGNSYPRIPEELERMLGRILSGETEPSPPAWRGDISALVAPHIELKTGEKIYGRAYRAVRGQKPSTVVLLGTGHGLEDGYYSVTDKDFETPLGIARTDREIVGCLRSAGGSVVAPHDIAHRREHSLEFQIIFLQHLFGPDIKLVPVLCGSFDGDLKKVSRPTEIPGVSDFLGTLGDLYADRGRDLLFVAGVDLSHIGPKFGHRETAASLVGEARKHDRTLIDAVCRGDVTRFWAEAVRVGNRFNVCGFSTLASLLEVISPASGVSLGYEFWREEATESGVSFAALVFTSG